MLPSTTDAYNQLQSFNSSRPSPTSFLDQANQKYGVDAANSQVSGLQSTIGNLQNAAAAVAPSVTGRTSGTFTTQGQRDALVNREQAPIITNLNTQGQQLGQAQSAQQQAQSLAGQYASGLASQDQQKYQSLLDQYNAANAADQFHQQQQAAAQQAASDQAYRQQQLSEQIREFNNPQNQGGSTADVAALLSSISGKSGGQTQGAQQAQRPGGGFNFTDANGTPINAAQYAQAKGVPYRTLLQQMANAGDSGAKIALDYVGNDFGADAAKVKLISPAAPYVPSLLKALGVKGY